jgi:Thiamine monophosphate synthase
MENSMKEAEDDNLSSSSILQNVHGIHVKESHQCYIPLFRACSEEQLSRHCQHHDDLNNDHDDSSNDGDDDNRACLIGTSAHSVDSAVQAYRKFQPDYFFVGTCFPTLSHPEKQQKDSTSSSSSSLFVPLEGPELPGQVARALEKETAALILQLQQHSFETDDNGPFRRGCDRPRVFAIGGIDASNSHEPVEHGADGVATIRSILQAAEPARAVRGIIENMMRQTEND